MLFHHAHEIQKLGDKYINDLCVLFVSFKTRDDACICFEQSIRKASNKQKKNKKRGRAGGDPCACIHVSPLCPLCFVCLCMDSSCPDSFGTRERERERRTPSIHIITIGCYRSTSVLLVKTAAANCIATASSSYAPAGR